MNQQPARPSLPIIDFNDALYRVSYLVSRDLSIKSYVFQYVFLLMAIAFFIYLYTQKNISEQVSAYAEAGGALLDDFFPEEVLVKEVIDRTTKVGSEARRMCYDTFTPHHRVVSPQAMELGQQAVEECYRQHEKLASYLFYNLYNRLFKESLTPWNAHVKQTVVEFAFLTGANFFSSIMVKLGVPFVIYAAVIFLLIKLGINRKNRGNREVRTLQQNIQEMRQDFTRLIDNPVRSGALQEQTLLDPVTGQPLQSPVVITLKNGTRITRDILPLLAELNEDCLHLRITPTKSIDANLVDFIAWDLPTLMAKRGDRPSLQNNDQTEITRYSISASRKIKAPAIILPWASLILAIYYYFPGFIIWHAQEFILNTSKLPFHKAMSGQPIQDLCLGLDASSKSPDFIVSYFNAKEKTRGNFSFHTACTGYMSVLFLGVFDNALKKAEDAITALSQEYRSQFPPSPILFIVGALFLSLYVFLINKQLVAKDTSLSLRKALNNIAKELAIDKRDPRKHSDAIIEEQLSKLDFEGNEEAPTDSVTYSIFRYPIKVFFLERGSNYKRSNTTLEWATLHDCLALGQTPTAAGGGINLSSIVAIEHDRAMMEKIRSLMVPLSSAVDIVLDAPPGVALRHRR